MIEAPPRGDDPGAGPVVAPRSLLKGIIAPRVEETLELLRERLKASDAPVEAGAGIVLTGGASQLAGVREVAVRVFDRTGPAWPPHAACRTSPTPRPAPLSAPPPACCTVRHSVHAKPACTRPRRSAPGTPTAMSSPARSLAAG